MFELINNTNEDVWVLGFRIWIFKFLVSYTNLTGHSFSFSFFIGIFKLVFQFGTVGLKFDKVNLGTWYDS
mgnify:CR=1 FL=1